MPTAVPEFDDPFAKVHPGPEARLANLVRILKVAWSPVKPSGPRSDLVARLQALVSLCVEKYGKKLGGFKADPLSVLGLTC